MQDADKLAARLALSLDGVIRRSVAAGKSVGDVFEGIKRLEPTIKSLEKRAGNLGTSAAALRNAQQILARYTPARLEKMAETAAARVAETSGTAALRRQLEKHGALIQRLVATQEGRYERATKGSPVGRGLFIDSETTGLNALRHQVVELTATLFSFNKATGEILNAAEQTYHGLQQLAFQSKHQYIPRGLTAQELQGQAISATMLRRLMQQADFVVAHNAPFDRKFVERIAPQAASMQWLDTMRGIPWRSLGFQSRSQQDLLRAHGIDPGQAHRSSSDVASAIRLLGSRSPLGGPTYLSMLMGNQGALNPAQQTLAVIKQMADELKGQLQERLGVGRSYDPVSVKYRKSFSTALSQDPIDLIAAKRGRGDNPRLMEPSYSGKTFEDLATKFAYYVVQEVEGQLTARSRRPATSTDYGISKGAGQAPEPTPGLLGEAAITLDRRIGVIDEFFRNMAIMSGPAAAGRFLDIYSQQQGFQERLQQSRGRGGRQIKAEIRPGEEVALATMKGVSTQLNNERLGVPSNTFMADLEKRQAEYRENLVAKMLQQPWAKPEKAFGPEEINEFIASHKSSPSVESIRSAAQMASHVGSKDPRFMALTSILLQGQESGRKIVAAKEAQAQKEAVERLASSTTKTAPRFRNVIGEAMRGLTSGFGNERGSIKLGDLFPWLSQRKEDPKLSYAERAKLPLPDPTNLRGSIRRDALESKLRKLEEGVDATAKAFEHYREVIASARAEQVKFKYDVKESAIAGERARSSISLDAQQDRLQARRVGSQTNAARRLSGIQEGFEGKASTLSYDELQAESRYDAALRRRNIAMNQAAKKYDKTSFQSLTKFQQEEVLEGLNEKLRPAELGLLRAQYKRQAASLTSEPDIEALRQKYAANAALTRFGKGTGTIQYMGQDRSLDELRSQYQQRILESVGGKTLAQKAEGRASQVVQDQQKIEDQLTSQEAQIAKRRELNEQKFSDQRKQNAAKTASAFIKIDDDVSRKSEAFIKKRAESEKKAHEAKVKYLKQEDVAGASGGNGQRGGGVGGGMFGGLLGGDASRSGFGFGIGLATLVGFDHALKDLIKDSAVYAARTQTMTVATHNMAQVAGLNVDEVDAQVEALKRMNLTTQASQAVVQRLMMTEIDLSKATGLVRVAQDLAAVSGQDAMEVTERLMSAIVTGYTRNLHMLGLQVTMTSAMNELRNRRKAEGLKGDPTEVEKRQALVNKILLEGAKISGTYEKSLMTAGGQYAYLRKEIQETANSLGQEFLPAFGRVVKMMTDGLHIVQEHSEGFATLAKILASVSAGLSVLGTASFARYLGVPMPPPLKAAVTAVAIGTTAATYIASSPDKSEASKKTSAEAISGINQKINELRQARKYLSEHMEDTPEWRNKFDANTAALKAYSDTVVDINRGLTDELAKEYLKRLDELNTFIAAQDGKLGKWAQIQTALGLWTFRGTIMDAPRSDAESGQQFLTRIGGRYAQQLAAPGIAPEDIRARAAQLRAQQLADLSNGPLVNQARVEAETLASVFNEAQKELSKLDEKYSDFGSAQKKALQAGETPRGKILSDAELEKSKINYSFITDLQKKVTSGDAFAAKKYEEFKKQLGSGDVKKGEEVINKALKEQLDIREKIDEVTGSELANLSRRTQSEIASIRLQTQIEKVNSQVVQGNYAAELKAADEVFEMKKKAAEADSKRFGSGAYKDELDKRIAEAEEERQQRQIQVEADQRNAARSRREQGQAQAAQVEAQAILDRPDIGAEDAIRQAFKKRIDATKPVFGPAGNVVSGIEDENKRLEEQMNLLFELDDALNKLSKDKKQLAAESRISTFVEQQNLQSELDRIVSTQRYRKTEAQRNLEEIERTRQRALTSAQFEYDQRQPITPSEGQDALKQQLLDAQTKANNQARVDTAKEVSQQKESARTRLADEYQKQFQQIERINELTAIGSKEESDAAYNTHVMRLEYIEKEYEARGKSLEAEKTREEEIQQAEFDQLQKLMAIRRKDLEEIRSAAGGIFDALTSHQPGAFSQFFLNEIKGMGRTIFSNLAVEYFKNIRQSVGTMIPGQETVDPVTGQRKTTRLGRVLSGTIFSQTHTEDIQKMLVSATTLNTTAEQELKKSIDQLDQTLKNITGQGGGLKVSTTGPASRAPVPDFNIYDSVGLGGGQDKNNPMIYHLLSQPTSIGKPGQSIAENTGAERENTRAIEALTRALSSKSSSGNQNIFQTAVNTISAVTMGMGGCSSFASPGGFGLGGGLPSQSIPVLYGLPPTPGSSGTPPSAGGSSGPGIPQFPGGVFGNSKAAKGIGGALLAAGGAYQAYSGFKQGGGRGIASGIGGTLTAAAGITAMIPGAQVATPFLLAGAMVADFIASLFGDPKQAKSNQIQNWISQHKFLGPVQVDSTQTLEGGQAVSYNQVGIPRSSGISALPIKIQPNRQIVDPYSFSGSNPPTYLEVPGYVIPVGSNYTPPPGRAAGGPVQAGMPYVVGEERPEIFVPGSTGYISPKMLPSDSHSARHVNYNITLPISAFDAKDVMARSSQIAAAITKELRFSNELSSTLQQAIFGQV